MKKKIIYGIMILFALIAVSTSVSAVSAESELETALSGTESTITLSGNIALSKPLEIERDVTIDLNGYTITPTSDFAGGDYMVGVHRQAHLTIKDSASNGKISNNGMELVIVKMTVYGENDSTYAAKFTLESGILENTYSGENGFATISGNGKRHNTEIVINGGTVKATKKHAIYQPQDGKITVNGGTIEGSTGIEIRSGTLKVNGGTIIGTGIPVTVAPNGSGTTTNGAGVAVAQHTTEKNIDVVINGGSIQGYSALYESNPQSNTTEDKVSIEVKGGDFEAINGGTLAVYSADKTNFITGGTFSSDVSGYVSSEFDAVKDEYGNVYVGTAHDIIVQKTENGTVIASLKQAVKGQTVKLTVIPDEGYKQKTLKVYSAADSEINVVNGTFVMPNLGTIVVAEFEKIEADEVSNKGDKDETPKTGVTNYIGVATFVLSLSLLGIVIVNKKRK